MKNVPQVGAQVQLSTIQPVCGLNKDILSKKHKGKHRKEEKWGRREAGEDRWQLANQNDPADRRPRDLHTTLLSDYSLQFSLTGTVTLHTSGDGCSFPPSSEGFLPVCSEMHAWETSKYSIPEAAASIPATRITGGKSNAHIVDTRNVNIFTFLLTDERRAVASSRLMATA